jgi:glucose-6-phosphate-specific signal transduction histidine kinase
VHISPFAASGSAHVDPWFRRRPRWALAVAGALFAGVFAVLLILGDPAEVSAGLYVLPVGLLAVAFGLRPGVCAGALSATLIYGCAQLNGAELSAFDWIASVAPILFVGLLLGDASDRLAAAHRLHAEIALASQRHREAIEINDSLVQGMAATKWLLESGRDDAALETLAETLRDGERLVSQLMRDAGIGRTPVAATSRR